LKIDSNLDVSTIEGQETINDIKTLILKSIDKAPGIRYGELLKLSALSNGALEYHLKILERTNKVRVDRRDGRRARFYPIDILAGESHILGYIRNVTAREIVLFILEHDLCTFGEIVEHMNKAPSTISWHLKRLSEEAGLVSISHGQELQLYKITNCGFMKYVLNKYREGFRDKLANHYYEMFGDL
jgi:predicted transcriptional regulator